MYMSKTLDPVFSNWVGLCDWTINSQWLREVSKEL